MYARLLHTSGKPILVPISEVVVYADNGVPVAITYEREKMIVHTDRSQADFSAVAASLAVGEISLE